MAKVCVVMATYNGERFLAQMLDSLAAQTRPADLIIVVDDGSADSTTQILENYRKRLPLQFFCSGKNQGHRAAFSKALELVRPQLSAEDLIALADQDDVWLPTKIDVLERALCANGKRTSLVFGDAEVIDGNGEKIADSWRTLAKISTELPMKAEIAGINNVTGCLSLFRAELLEKIVPIPEGISVHDRWIAMLAMKFGGVTAIPEKIVQYRLHGQNAVGNRNDMSLSQVLDTQILWAKALIQNANRLKFSRAELDFAKEFLDCNEKRKTRRILPGKFFWIFRNRRFLFPKDSTIKTLKRILFTATGLPLAKKLWGKS